MGKLERHLIKTRPRDAKKILVIVATAALAFATTMPAFSQTSGKTNHDKILNYVTTTFEGHHHVDSQSVKMVSSKMVSLYGHDIFAADVQLTKEGKHVPFYLDTATNNIYEYSMPTFSQVTGLRMSYELWNALQHVAPDDELHLVISLKVNGLQSVNDHLPYGKMNVLDEVGQDVKQQMILASGGGKNPNMALRQQIEDLKSKGSSLAAEIESVSNGVRANNAQMIRPVVQDAVYRLGQIDGVQVLGNLELIPVVSIKAKASSINKILEMPNVEEVMLDAKSTPSLAISVPTILANTVWAAMDSGSGVNTAVLDTGISGNANLSVCAAHDSTGSGTTNDQNGHGTAVAGVIASTNPTLRGVSSGSCLMNAKIASSDGTGTLAWLEDGAQWAINNGAFVLEHSRNISDTRGDGTNDWAKAVDYYVDHYGIIWSNSAGNKNPHDATSQVITPGDAYNALTVGAMDDQNTTNRSDDVLAAFSRICCTLDSRDKPDIVAPGASIHTTTNTGSFAVWSGTSFAAPHVAGVAALLKSDRPDLTQLLTKAVILNAAVSDTATGHYDLGKGWGYLQAYQSWQDDYFTDSSSVANGHDAFKYVNANAGDKIAITLTWDRHMTDASTILGTSDLDLYLYAPSGQIIASSTSSIQNVEVVYVIAPVSGKYMVDVNGFDVPSSIGTETYALASNRLMSAT